MGPSQNHAPAPVAPAGEYTQNSPVGQSASLLQTSFAVWQK